MAITKVPNGMTTGLVNEVGGSVITPARLDVKQDTYANLVTYAATASNGQMVFATDQKKMFQVVDGALTVIGGEGTGINYIDNFSFESDPDGVQPVGWNRYLDPASASPSDGSGAGATITFLASITDPLRETKSAIINKTGSAQGQGVSYDFTIDSADKAQVLRLSFDYSSSALYADDNLRAYFYDVTNAQLIEVVDRNISASAQGKYVGTFQTNSNSTSYRLILHVADSTSNNWTMKIDNVIVGPQTLIKGAITTDWQSYTPTFTGFGTVPPASIDFRYRRVGDSVQIQGKWTNGTVTATEARVSLPSGLVTLSGIATAPAGNMASGNITSDNFFPLFQAGLSYLTFSRSNNGSFASASASTIFNNSEVEAFNATVPIQGWSSNVVLSEDSGNRLIAQKAQGSTTSITGGSNAVMVNPTSVYDTTSSYNTSTGQYTIPESGWYRASAAIKFVATLATTSTVTIVIRLNSSTEIGVGRVFGNGASNSWVVTANTEFYATKGNTVEFLVSSSTTSITLSGGASGDNYSAITKISSPQTLAGSETVAVRAVQSSGQSIANTGVPVDLVWDSAKTYDTHNAFVSSTGIFTAPVSGKYRISAKCKSVGAAWTATNTIQMGIKKNAAVYSTLMDHSVQGTGTFEITFSGSDTVSLSKGDTLNVYIAQTRTGGSITLANNALQNFIDIERVGN